MNIPSWSFDDCAGIDVDLVVNNLRLFKNDGKWKGKRLFVRDLLFRFSIESSSVGLNGIWHKSFGNNGIYCELVFNSCLSFWVLTFELIWRCWRYGLLTHSDNLIILILFISIAYK